MKNCLIICALKSSRLGFLILLFLQPCPVLSATLLKLEPDKDTNSLLHDPVPLVSKPDIVVEPHHLHLRHRHHYLVEDSQDKNENTPTSLLSSDNNNNIQTTNLLTAKGPEGHKSSPPAYLNVMYGKLSESSSSLTDESGTVLRALFPSSLQFELVDGTLFLTSKFQLGHEGFGHFIGAQLTITVDEEVMSRIVENGKRRSIQLYFERQGQPILQTTLSLQSQFKFYTFDLTKVLQRHDRSTPSINFLFKLTTPQGKKDEDEDERILFSNFFNSLSTERPLILFRYQNLPFIQENMDEDMVSGLNDPSESWERSNSGENRSHKKSRYERRRKRTVEIGSETVQMKNNESQNVDVVSISEKSPVKVEYSSETKFPDHNDEQFNNSSTTKLHHSSSTTTAEPSNLSSSSDERITTSLSPPSFQKLRPELCQRHEWLVRPEDIGLRNVLFPEFLDLGYCAGDCPFPLQDDRFNFTLHSYYINSQRLLKHVADLPSNFPIPKCVPVSYKTIMVISFVDPRSQTIG